jgi:RNA polymerase sigma factor (sigma-70 family)
MELDDEVRLAHLIRADDATATRARRQCVNANARLVIGVARTFEGRGLRLDQLIEAGNEGLLRAAEQFDWRQGRKFAPYAASWIRQSIQHALTSETASVPRAAASLS